MRDKLVAPWTEEQVATLNRYQASGIGHQYTCGWDTCGGKEETGLRMPLVATDRGWCCSWRECSYTQDWAHGFDADAGVLAARIQAFEDWIAIGGLREDGDDE